MDSLEILSGQSASYQGTLTVTGWIHAEVKDIQNPIDYQKDLFENIRIKIPDNYDKIVFENPTSFSLLSVITGGI